MTEPTPLYPRVPEITDEERRLLGALVKSLRPGDQLVSEPGAPDRVIRRDPPSIRTVGEELRHMGLTS